MLITYQANYILLNNTFDLFKTPFNLHIFVSLYI